MPSAQDEVRRILPASYVHPCPLGSQGYPFPLNYMLSRLLLLPLNWHAKAGEWLERNALLSSADGTALASRKQVVESVEWMLSALFPAVPCWEDQVLQAVWETGALTTGKTFLQYDLETNSFPICVRKHSRPLPGLYCFCWGWCSRKRGGEKLILQDFCTQTGRRHQHQPTAPRLEAAVFKPWSRGEDTCLGSEWQFRSCISLCGVAFTWGGRIHTVAWKDKCSGCSSELRFFSCPQLCKRSQVLAF